VRIYVYAADYYKWLDINKPPILWAYCIDNLCK